MCLIFPNWHPRNSSNESRISPFNVNNLSRTCSYSSHQVSSRSLHSERFPRFSVPPPTPFNVTGSSWDLKCELWDTRSFKLSYFIKIWSPVRKLKYLIFQNFPNYKESQSGLIISIMYLGLMLILHSKYHYDFSTLKVFQDFMVSSSNSPNVTTYGQDFNRSSETRGPSTYHISLGSNQPFLSWKIPHFF